MGQRHDVPHLIICLFVERCACARRLKFAYHEQHYAFFDNYVAAASALYIIVGGSR
jgi:hypothetical protein